MGTCGLRRFSSMSLCRLLCLILCAMILVFLPDPLVSVAATRIPFQLDPELATPSDALTPDDEEYYTDWSEFLDEYGENDDLTSIVTGLYMLLSGDTSILGPDLAATPSDANQVDAVDSGDVYVVDAVEMQADDISNLTNVVCYHVTFGGSDYDLYLSSDYIDNLYVDGSGRLWNVSGNNISGRLFQNGFTPTDTTGRILTLGPCLGNNFSNNRNYGSPNYVRRYYWSGNNLTYDTTYGVVTVSNYQPPLLASYLPMILILVLLCVIVLKCFRR